jgi:integrase
VRDFTFHDREHTCAAWLVQAGVPPRTVAEILRHASIQTTMRYAHLSPDDARAGVAALERSKSRSDERQSGGQRSHFLSLNYGNGDASE